MQHIRDVKERLKVGQWIRTNGNGYVRACSFEFVEGMIGKIVNNKVCIFEIKGYRYQRIVDKTGDFEIEILREPEEFRVGDRVKVFKKSTGDCSEKNKGYPCCNKYIGKVGTVYGVTVYDVTKDKIGVDNFPNLQAHCSSFSPDCLSLMERGDKNEATKEQLKQVIKLVDNQKGEVEMKEIVRKVYTKDSLETAELVDREMSDIDLGQGFMSVLALTEKKDIVLKEAKRRKKEREDRESK